LLLLLLLPRLAAGPLLLALPLPLLLPPLPTTPLPPTPPLLLPALPPLAAAADARTGCGRRAKGEPSRGRGNAEDVEEEEGAP
jgi:hypothetical protein